MYHFDGLAWSIIQQVDVLGSSALWAFATDDVLFAYPDGVLRWNGHTWTRISRARIDDLWASTPHDIYGISGSWIFHSDGAEFSQATWVRSLRSISNSLRVLPGIALSRSVPGGRLCAVGERAVGRGDR